MNTDPPRPDAKDDLIIATYRRPAALVTCLESVLRQTHVPASVTIIEGESEAQASLTNELKQALGDRLRHLVVPPGLTRQRNLGVSVTDGEIVHFVDDDVVLEDDYFEKVLEVFAQDPGAVIGGVGGLITNLPRGRGSVLNKLFLLDGPQGSLLSSGKNVLVRNASAPLEVEWLSGSTMSFRRGVFETVSFDEGRAGYGWGEDVDFSSRVALSYKLIVNPAARLQHRQTPVGRYDERASLRSEAAHRYDLARRRVGRVRPFWFWYSVLGEILMLVGLFIIKRKSQHLRRALLLAEAARFARSAYADFRV